MEVPYGYAVPALYAAARSRQGGAFAGRREGTVSSYAPSARNRAMKAWLCIGMAVLLGGCGTRDALRADAPESLNLALVGSDDLQARSAYQPVVHEQGGRWIAYIGHHGGTEKVPSAQSAHRRGRGQRHVDRRRHRSARAALPRAHSRRAGPGRERRRADGARVQRARAAAGRRAKFYLLRTFGNSAHEIWDVTDPAKPALPHDASSRLKGTHKNWWECDTGIAYLVSGARGWRTRRMTQVYDLSRSGEAGLHPQLRPAGPAAGLDGRRADRAARPDLHRARRATASISATAPTRAASCRSSIARSCSTDRRSRRDANLRYPEVGRLDAAAHRRRAHRRSRCSGMDVAEFAKDKARRASATSS